MVEHIPVLAEEVITGLQLSPAMVVVDATLGLGGHARLMLEVIGPQGKLYGFDRDDRNLIIAKDNLATYGNQFEFIRDSYANLGHYNLPAFDAILFDLGYSSAHVDDPTRGFSFMHEGPLDMRYDQSQELTAQMVVGQMSKEDLAKILRQLGEETFANQIADAIVKARREERIVTTTQLADLIAKTIHRRGKIHPATKTFQALRIFVNDELGEVERGLAAAVAGLKSGGRIAVLTFHSLEDRLVKQYFKNCEQLEVLTKKPVVAGRAETLENPRARSAKLRIARRI